MLQSYALTDQGKVRSNNQDTFRIVPELGLYLLADGMGGARGGERAANLAVDSTIDFLKRSEHRDAAALSEAFGAANKQVFAESQRDPRLEGMGTTLVAALEIGPGAIAIASVGDTRAWLLADGVLQQITVDQTWVQEVGRPSGLDEDTLLSHPMRHVLTMAIGVAPAVRIQRYSIHLQAGNLLLLSSDGLHGVVNEQIMRQILSAEGLLEEKCHKLIAAAYDAGSPDNVTVVLVQREPGQTPS